MTLTPGVAVFSGLFTQMDSNGDGSISDTEQRQYAEEVLHDLTLEIDGHRLALQLVSVRFPTTDEMREGNGEIQLDYGADLPVGGRNRKLTLENHHQSRISAYQVNCLVPRDPSIRIMAQDRNYSQSLYRLDYQQTDLASGPSFPVLGMGATTLLLLAALGLWWRQRGWMAPPWPCGSFPRHAESNFTIRGSEREQWQNPSDQ
jgi:hypothetical protein